MVNDKEKFDKLQQEQRDLDESYQQSKRNKKEREEQEEEMQARQNSYFEQEARDNERRGEPREKYDDIDP